MLRFLGFRPFRLSLNLCLFAVFGVVAMALAAPRVAEGFREQAPPLPLPLPLPTLRPIVGPVTRIVDGDTLWIGRNKIRLWGIDAPELSTANGPTATRYLAMVVGNYPLTCRQAGARSYDRLVARCLDPWGRDVAEIMVGAGWAVDWPKFSKGRYRPAEDRAAALRAGIHGQSPAAWR